jgi:hypothetical protein
MSNTITNTLNDVPRCSVCGEPTGRHKSAKMCFRHSKEAELKRSRIYYEQMSAEKKEENRVKAVEYKRNKRKKEGL